MGVQNFAIWGVWPPGPPPHLAQLCLSLFPHIVVGSKEEGILMKLLRSEQWSNSWLDLYYKATTYAGHPKIKWLIRHCTIWFVWRKKVHIHRGCGRGKPSSWARINHPCFHFFVPLYGARFSLQKCEIYFLFLNALEGGYCFQKNSGPCWQQSDAFIASLGILLNKTISRFGSVSSNSIFNR